MQQRKFLGNARIVAKHAALDVSSWPTDNNLECISKSWEKMALALSTEEASITYQEANIAIDEWLTSDRHDELTIEQRCILGCALLELFYVLPRLGRLSPSIIDAIHNIWPAFKIIPRDSIVAIRNSTEELMINSSHLDLNTTEVAELQLFSLILDSLLGKRVQMSIDSIATHVENVRADYFLDELQFVEEAIENCQCLSLETKRWLKLS